MRPGSPKVMVTISQIAERDGISRQAVSKALLGLLRDHDIPVERDVRGRVAKVSLAHWDHHRSRYATPEKLVEQTSASSMRHVVENQPDSFEEARRLGEWLKVERGQLRLEELRSGLIRGDLLKAGLHTVQGEIQSVISSLADQADALAAAVSREGVHGLRVMLRQVAFDLNSEIANRMAAIAQEAPASDEDDNVGV